MSARSASPIDWSGPNSLQLKRRSRASQRHHIVAILPGDVGAEADRPEAR